MSRLSVVLPVLLSVVACACGGDLVPVGSLSSNVVPAPGKTRRLALGSRHACARLDDGAVKCWGRNDDNQLGVDAAGNIGDEPHEMGSALRAVDLGPGRIALDIVAGAYHTCARLDDGAVKCWGSGSLGQLGLGENEPRVPGEPPKSVDLGRGRTAVEIAAGAHHTCARLDDGAVKCWGSGGSGALGLGDEQIRGWAPGQMGDALPSVDLGPDRVAVEIAAGGNHTCARLDDGSVRCWGDNTHAQLGLGEPTECPRGGPCPTTARGDEPGEMGSELPAVDLGTGRTAVELALGEAHTCALLDDGSVRCWGDPYRGALGTPSPVGKRGDRPSEMGDALPRVDLGPDRAVEITAGGHATCARLEDGKVKCWGDVMSEDLVLGALDKGAVPTLVELGTRRRAVEIRRSTDGHTCAVLDDGSIKCWGDNADGQLGLGDRKQRGYSLSELGDALPPVQLE